MTFHYIILLLWLSVVFRLVSPISTCRRHALAVTHSQPSSATFIVIPLLVVAHNELKNVVL